MARRFHALRFGVPGRAWRRAGIEHKGHQGHEGKTGFIFVFLCLLRVEEIQYT